MPRGHVTIRVPEIPLSRDDIVVHPAARKAFEFFRQYVGNPHPSAGLPQLCAPILEFSGKGAKRQLIGGFQHLVLIPKEDKLTCLVVERDVSNHESIEAYAWQQVLLSEPLRRIDNRAIAAMFHALEQGCPEHVVQRLYPPDPDSPQGLQLITESLCRALRLSSNSIRPLMPSVRGGGIESHSYDDKIIKKDHEDEEN